MRKEVLEVEKFRYGESHDSSSGYRLVEKNGKRHVHVETYREGGFSLFYVRYAPRSGSGKLIGRVENRGEVENKLRQILADEAKKFEKENQGFIVNIPDGFLGEIPTNSPYLQRNSASRNVARFKTPEKRGYVRKI